MKKTLIASTIVLLLLAFLPARTAEAQVIRFFLLPVEQVGSYRGPQFLPWRFDPDPQNSVACRWSMRDYGTVNTAIVAVDCDTQAQIDELSAKAGIFVIPANLDTNTTPAERSALTTYLEATFVPANWLASSTWRQTIRTITGMYLFNQCMTAQAGDPLTSGIALNTQFRNLPQIWQDAINSCYAALGYTVNYSANTTLRSLLKLAADQWGARIVDFGFVTL